jgi:hypothetical protein
VVPFDIAQFLAGEKQAKAHFQLWLSFDPRTSTRNALAEAKRGTISTLDERFALVGDS